MDEELAGELARMAAEDQRIRTLAMGKRSHDGADSRYKHRGRASADRR